MERGWEVGKGLARVSARDWRVASRCATVRRVHSHITITCQPRVRRAAVERASRARLASILVRQKSGLVLGRR